MKILTLAWTKLSEQMMDKAIILWMLAGATAKQLSCKYNDLVKVCLKYEDKKIEKTFHYKTMGKHKFEKFNSNLNFY